MNPLPVEHIFQEEEYYCGPAVAAMILAFHKSAPGAKSTRILLAPLWGEISDVRPTAGGSIKHPKAHSCIGYKNGVTQVFFNCRQTACRAWSTTTAALLSVLNKHLPAAHQMSSKVDSGSG